MRSDMNNLITIALLILTTFYCPACSEQNGNPSLPGPTEGNNQPAEDATENKTLGNMEIIIDGKTFPVVIEDNAAARDLISRLPLEITLNDFNNTTEKIFYPEPALTLNGVPRGCAPVPGDITIYVPWGNVAIFCKEWSYSNDLVKIGHIDGNGIDGLRVEGDIKVTFRVSEE